jgi:hypothetical protein
MAWDPLDRHTFAWRTNLSKQAALLGLVGMRGLVKSMYRRVPEDGIFCFWAHICWRLAGRRWIPAAAQSVGCDPHCGRGI